uniref:CsAtPR5 n=1 Tax=Aegilops tauschii TaxID=37682 RepID=Q8LK50_AEGTA|nr:csAtPR5 [Aegilops tauschii]
MESESGMETEGGSSKGAEYLREEFNALEIELGKCRERASGKDEETVRDLTRRYQALRRNRELLNGPRFSVHWKEMHARRVSREVLQMLSELKKLKDSEKLARKKERRKLMKQKKLLHKMRIERDSSEEVARDPGEHQSLMEEIISAERERKGLLGSLTPTFSIWKQVDSQTTWTLGPSTATASDENQLAEYFSLMLQDVEDLGHRMLSMLYFLNKSNATICSYKATELCSTTTRLNMEISKGFTLHEPEQEHGPETEPGQINLSALFSKYCRFPNNYDHTLAQLDMEEEKKIKCEDIKVTKTKEEEDKENDPSTIEYFKKSLELDQYFFAQDRKYWENGWASKIGRCGGFANTTHTKPLCSLHTTHLAASHSLLPSLGTTLQIYSIKIKNLKGLNWPLKVYGKVAARDTVDRNRNILFSRPKFDYQELNGENDSLCLIGPSRAIVSFDHVDFEVELKVIDEAESQRLIICTGRYGGTDDFYTSSASVTYGGDGPTFLLSNHRCTTELTLEQLHKSHQATIVGIRVTKGDWPFKHGCRVICFWAPSAVDVIDTTCRSIVLLDDRDKEIHSGSGKYLHLSRRVVSVKSYGILRVTIEAYGGPGQCIAQKGHVDFPVKQCQTTAFDCVLGDTALEVVVAWSLLIKDKMDLQVQAGQFNGEKV